MTGNDADQRALRDGPAAMAPEPEVDGEVSVVKELGA